MRSRRLIVGISGLLLVGGLSACAPKVVDLGSDGPPPRWPDQPIHATLAVEPLSVLDGGFLARDAVWLQQSFEAAGLAEALRRRRIFARVDSGYGEATSSDLVLRGAVTGSWDPRAAANFATWFPGGLALAPNWYGTRMEYRAQATLELSVRATGELLETIVASSDHEVIHRSGSPGPFFGAIIVVPNVMRGVRLAYPRTRYTELVYPIAHERLWDEVAAAILASIDVVGPAALAAQRERCGDRLDEPPRIGARWSDFIACQSSDYAPSDVTDAPGRLPARGDPAMPQSVHFDAASGTEITVVDDTIVRLRLLPKRDPGAGGVRR